jgi:hypothetical protein
MMLLNMYTALFTITHAIDILQLHQRNPGSRKHSRGKKGLAITAIPRRKGVPVDSRSSRAPRSGLEGTGQAAGNLGTMRPSRTYEGRGRESMLYFKLGRSGGAGTAAFGSNSWRKNRVLAHMSSTGFTPTVRHEEPRKDSLVDVGNVVGNRRQPEQQGN